MCDEMCRGGRSQQRAGVMLHAGLVVIPGADATAVSGEEENTAMDTQRLELEQQGLEMLLFF